MVHKTVELIPWTIPQLVKIGVTLGRESGAIVVGENAPPLAHREVRTKDGLENRAYGISW